MTALFLEPFSGLSGDMLNALLLDLGADANHLKNELNKLHLSDEYHITIEKCLKSSISGTDFDVHLTHTNKDHGILHDHHGHEHHSHDHVRTYTDIKELIEESELSDFVKEKSQEVFLDIAKAEARVHNKSISAIHFHEVGATDSIIDIIGFFILFESLAITQVHSTQLTEGSGFIHVAHGRMPVPVPAVMELRKHHDIPIVQDSDIKTELITPTGLAILKALKPQFCQQLHGKIRQVGYGFGKKDTGKLNALRASLVDIEAKDPQNKILKIEATIDDQSPEELGYLFDLFFENGAIDVYIQNVLMKKNRPANLITLLLLPEDLDKFTELLFKESSTIGFRYQVMERKVMERSQHSFQSSLGEVSYKVSRYKTIKKQKIEHDDCAKIAKKTKQSIQTVTQTIQQELSLKD